MAENVNDTMRKLGVCSKLTDVNRRQSLALRGSVPARYSPTLLSKSLSASPLASARSSISKPWANSQTSGIPSPSVSVSSGAVGIPGVGGAAVQFPETLAFGERFTRCNDGPAPSAWDGHGD